MKLDVNKVDLENIESALLRLRGSLMSDLDDYQYDLDMDNDLSEFDKKYLKMTITSHTIKLNNVERLLKRVMGLNNNAD